MPKNIRMDTHKLIYHPQTVADWMGNKIIYPIEVEISPSGACNHRCVFCAVDYIGYQPNFLDKGVILRTLREMKEKGLKSVICSGEGEPLLNKNLPSMVNEIKSYGIDVAMASNAVLFTKESIKECLSAFTWIRFSVASLDKETYAQIHRGKDGDLERVKQNLEEAVHYKRSNQLKTTLGVQCLLIPDNVKYLTEMAKELRNIGVDYFTVKPYSQHLHSNNHYLIDYNRLLDLEKELKSIETEDFKIYFRANAMKKMNAMKCYDKCYGMSFMSHIDAKGDVWPCVAHIGIKDLCFGNIYESSFQEIWEGMRRREIMDKINLDDINSTCREACRLDEINKYLYDLKYPNEHVNFI